MAQLMYAQKVRRQNLSTIQQLVNRKGKIDLKQLKAIMSINFGLSPESTEKYIAELEDFGLLRVDNDFVCKIQPKLETEVKHGTKKTKK